VSGSISNPDKSGVVSLVEDARVVGFLILASDERGMCKCGNNPR
jgi:hypothetical protein